MNPPIKSSHNPSTTSSLLYFVLTALHFVDMYYNFHHHLIIHLTPSLSRSPLAIYVLVPTSLFVQPQGSHVPPDNSCRYHQRCLLHILRPTTLYVPFHRNIHRLKFLHLPNRYPLERVFNGQRIKELTSLWFFARNVVVHGIFV